VLWTILIFVVVVVVVVSVTLVLLRPALHQPLCYGTGWTSVR